MEVFKPLVEHDLENSKMNPGRHKREIEKGLELLENNKQIVIRGADKGGGLVILNKSDYLDKLNRLVDDVETYEKLKGNPTDRYKAKLND